MAARVKVKALLELDEVGYLALTANLETLGMAPGTNGIANLIDASKLNLHIKVREGDQDHVF